eukprot:g18979.t2
MVCGSDFDQKTLSLLYVDPDDLSTQAGTSSDASSRASGSGRLRGVPVVRVFTSKPVLKASSLDRNAVEEFRSMLENHGINTAMWGRNRSKSLEQLFWEVFYHRGCILTGIGTLMLKRVTRILKLRVLAEVDGAEHLLVSRLQFLHDGQQIQRHQVPVCRLCWKMPDDNSLVQNFVDKDSRLIAEECSNVEHWKSRCISALEEILGVSSARESLEEDASAYSYVTQDNLLSDGYPGLRTLYCVHQVTFKVIEPHHPKVACIGLPHGQESAWRSSVPGHHLAAVLAFRRRRQDFATADEAFDLERFHSKDQIPIGSQLNVWSWTANQEVVQAGGRSAPRGLSLEPDGTESKAMRRLENELMLEKRVPVPMSQSLTAAKENVMGARSTLHPKEVQGKKGAPNPHLRRILQAKRTDWKTVRSVRLFSTDRRRLFEDGVAMHDPQDLTAFPELFLYLRDGVIDAGSGRTTDDEYQRTVCAFFAIYWLMRLDIDGRQGFSFGMDDDWNPLQDSMVKDGQVSMPKSTASVELQQRLYKLDRRLAFFNNAQWGFFRRLMIDADLLEMSNNGRGQYKVKETRMVSLLALTAIHDIMKMDALLPTVQPEHDGYSAGDVIGDHDHALCYLMDHYPDLLPSFKELDLAERQSVQFTQCNLCFNHGWLVQAEAPPGAIFTKFREAINRDRKLHAGEKDVALYFVHWLTDLAGAEPTPLGGCEKFVIKFPLHVLNSFLQSFKFIEGITSQSETEVMEKYLKYRWSDHVPSLGQPPVGPHSIAAMRLLCMAQANGRAVCGNGPHRMCRSTLFGRLGATRRVLSCCPGCHEPHEVGPAFLVYGPAFLQAQCSDAPVLRLRILTEIYRCARELWPEATSLMATSVHVRIDTIKGLRVQEIRDVLAKGELWLITKHNESEAYVGRASHKKLNKFPPTKVASDRDESGCSFSLMPLDVPPPRGPLFIFGDPFLRRFVTIYDKSGPSVGFAVSKQNALDEFEAAKIIVTSGGAEEFQRRKPLDCWSRREYMCWRGLGRSHFSLLQYRDFPIKALFALLKPLETHVGLSPMSVGLSAGYMTEEEGAAEEPKAETSKSFSDSDWLKKIKTHTFAESPSSLSGDAVKADVGEEKNTPKERSETSVNEWAQKMKALLDGDFVQRSSSAGSRPRLSISCSLRSAQRTSCLELSGVREVPKARSLFPSSCTRCKRLEKQRKGCMECISMQEIAWDGAIPAFVGGAVVSFVVAGAAAWYLVPWRRKDAASSQDSVQDQHSDSAQLTEKEDSPSSGEPLSLRSAAHPQVGGAKAVDLSAGVQDVQALQAKVGSNLQEQERALEELEALQAKVGSNLQGQERALEELEALQAKVGSNLQEQERALQELEAGLQADLHRAQIRDAWLCGSPFPQQVARTQFEVGGDSEVFFPPDCLGRKELFSQRAVDICRENFAD